MIVPTIGRIVWYYPPGRNRAEQAYPAIVCYVHSDTCINVAGFDSNANPFRDTSVLLIQDPDAYGNPHGGAWAQWMPYQHKAAGGAL